MIQTASDRETGIKVASLLLEIQAVKLNVEKPFLWASGWHSPIYCDNRISLGFPEVRSYIKSCLAQKIKQVFPECEAIAGVATAGIPQGVLVADSLDLSFLYVRSKPKGHGLKNLIEGKYSHDQKVVVLEDLISTGGSSLKAVDALRNAGMKVLGLAAIFTYGFDIAGKNFTEAQVPWFSLSNYHILLEFAVEQGIVSPTQYSLLQEWRKEPGEWKVPG
jgi:orotate phosphoribosyltransferase